MPDLTKYLEQRNINGLDGPWVLLDGYFTQNDEVRGRKLFSFVRSFLVQSKRWPYSTSKRFTQNEIARFRSLAALQHQVPSLYYAFSGEIPWCSVFPNAEKVTLDLGNSIPALSLEVPVVSVAWEGEFFDEKRIGGTTLAPSLARVVNLVNIPQSYDLQTVSGDRATLSVRIHDENSRNTEHFLFIKKDILKRLLQKRRLSLFWYVWGERDWSIERIVNNMSADNRQNRRYKDFHSIHLPDF